MLTVHSFLIILGPFHDKLPVNSTVKRFGDDVYEGKLDTVKFKSKFRVVGPKDMEKCTKVAEICLLVFLIREKLTVQVATFSKMDPTTKDNLKITKLKRSRVIITLNNFNIEVDSRTTLSTGKVAKREENTSTMVPTITENEPKDFSNGILSPITMYINTSTKENLIRMVNSTEKANFKRSREYTKDNLIMEINMEKERISIIPKLSLSEITSEE